MEFITIFLFLVAAGLLTYYYKDHAITSIKMDHVPRFLPQNYKDLFTSALLDQFQYLATCLFWPEIIQSSFHISFVLIVRFNEWLYETNIWFKNKPWKFTAPVNSINGNVHGTFIVINDPKSLEHVLNTNFINYIKGDLFDSRMHDILGSGIFNADGDLWKIQRKTALNIFSVKNYKEFVGNVFLTEMNLLGVQLARVADESLAIDLQELFFKFTLDSFCKIGFNVTLNCMESPEPVPFAAAFDRAQTQIDYRFVSPFWNLEEMILPVGKQMRTDAKTIKDFSMDIIRKKNNSAIYPDSYDLLTLFSNLKSHTGEKLFSDESLSEIVLNFIIAGRDTTAQALSWTFYELAKNPKVKENLECEIQNLLGISKKITYEDIKEMKYARAVVLETLRLHPSVPKDLKLAVKDDILPDGTFIPSGANISWSAYSMGRTEAIWGKDATTFDPSRWIKMETQPSPYEFPVFHAGPRMCLGKSMAEIEMVYVLVSILSQFDFQVKNLSSVRYASSVTLPMAKGGLQVSITRRA